MSVPVQPLGIVGAAASIDKCIPALLHRVRGLSIPSGWERILGQGHPRPPPSHARATIGLQRHIKGNHGLISQSGIPSILLTARRKAKQQGILMDL